jgi:hypothetical protein
VRSLIRHENRFTEEWTVLRDPQSSLKDWITGGIGVDGDSGAWIIDRDSGALYGMVWGRDRIKHPICLFSPILDIIADIKEQNRVKMVSLPREGVPVMLKEGKEESILTPPISQALPHDIRIDRFPARQNSFPEMIGATGAH